MTRRLPVDADVHDAALIDPQDAAPVQIEVRDNPGVAVRWLDWRVRGSLRPDEGFGRVTIDNS